MRYRGAWFERAPSTRILLWANVAVFVAGVALARTPRALVGLPEHVLYAIGMSDALAVFRELRVETLVTSCFVHASLLHLLANLYALVEIGPPVERALGTTRMAVLYLVSGVSGSLASATVGWLAETERTSEGFSGALCGVIGAALVFGLVTDGKKSVLARSMLRWVGLLVIVQVAAALLGAASHLDNAAHLGAALTGAFLGAIWGVKATKTTLDSPSPRLQAGGHRVSWIKAEGLGLIAAASFAVLAVRVHRDPFSTLGATERCDLASLLIRSGQCEGGRSALDAASRLLSSQPTVMALEGEWRRVCEARPGGASPRS